MICHNPNLSSSGRTIDPATPHINPDVITGTGSSNPLTYPEATNNFKELIHGIHASSSRPYEFVRNRTSVGLTGFYYNWDEVTYPGNLRNCEKCHIATGAGTDFPNEAPGSRYDAQLPAGVLWTTEKITTGITGEIRSQIVAARNNSATLGQMNSTDLVNGPTASACYYCHDNALAKDHMVLQGFKYTITREEALAAP